MSTERYLTIQDAALELAELIFDKDSLLTDMQSWGIPKTSFDDQKKGAIETRKKLFISQLNDAIRRNEIIIRHPYTLLPYSPETRRDFWEVMSLTELNSWLDKIGVDYRLLEVGTNNSIAVIETNSGINRNQVIGAFTVKTNPDENFRFWDDKLGRPPKWLADAVVQRGKPGESTLWNPLLVAHALLDKKYMKCHQLDSVINKNFPGFLDDWKEQTEDKR